MWFYTGRKLHIHFFFHMRVMKANIKSDCYTEGWLRLFLPTPEKCLEIYFVFTFLKRNVCLWIRNTICWKAQGFTRTKYHLKLYRESWNTRNFIRSWYQSVLLPDLCVRLAGVSCSLHSCPMCAQLPRVPEAVMSLLWWQGGNRGALTEAMPPGSWKSS